MNDRAGAHRAAIERPLRYLRGADAKRIGAVKNLSRHILEVSRKALAEGLPETEMRLFRSLQEMFGGFEELSARAKKERIEKALSMIGPVEPGPGIRTFRPEEHLVPSIERLREARRVLSRSVQYVRGVGPAIARKLSGADVSTVFDLLMFFPFRYEDRRTVTRIGDLEEGRTSVACGKVVFCGVAFYRGLRRRVFETVLEDGSGELKLKWFRFPAGTLEVKIRRGQQLIVCGKARRYRNALEMHHPEFEVHAGVPDSTSFGRIVPVYREVGGLYQRTLRKIQFGALATYADQRICAIPPEICRRQDLMPPWRALRELHQPSTLFPPERRTDAHRSLAFEELFFYCLSLAVRKRKLADRPGIRFDRATPRYDLFLKQLPFELTGAQAGVLRSIRSDMAAPRAMNRLLQGDVGSGKTVVAFLAALAAVDHGFQAAYMAPTEILAEQHFRTLTLWAERARVRMALLLGRLGSAERRPILEGAQAGRIDLLLGTHALLEERVRFANLGLAIVDEQHRFGVRQRAALRSKSREPDVLVMSATPIPRTLALTLYGDLDVSILDELPQGRKPIETRVFSERERQRVYDLVRAEVKKGRQAYVVYPLVSESEALPAKDATSMAQSLRREVFPDLRVGLVHGQMSPAERSDRMARFGSGKLDVLVSTTVIEVGIDVPNATVMVIEHPERFGLSQLHQLRGRVGRGSERSACLLIRPPGISEVAAQRLRTFANLHDGFLLAEEDLRLRGPGDFFGVAQSGFPSFRAAVFPRDLDLLEAARREAFRILQFDPALGNEPHRHLTWVIDELWAERLSWVRVG